VKHSQKKIDIQKAVDAIDKLEMTSEVKVERKKKRDIKKAEAPSKEY